MLAYRHPSNSNESYLLPSLENSASAVQPFTCGPDINDTSYSGEVIPSIDSAHYAYYPQYDYFRTFPETQPQSRLSLQMNPFTSTMEPYLFYPQGAYPSQPNTQFAPSTYPMAVAPEMISPTAASAISPDVMSFMSSHDEFYTTPVWQQNLPVFLPQDYDQTASTDDGLDATDGLEEFEEDDSNNFDKPYAQLIYEALMQAPGHRMLLRDIYEWFMINTRKPRESGTNGWQNSIRHNLSMNQVSFSSTIAWKTGSLTMNRHLKTTRMTQLYRGAPKRPTVCGC